MAKNSVTSHGLRLPPAPDAILDVFDWSLKTFRGPPWRVPPTELSHLSMSIGLPWHWQYLHDIASRLREAHDREATSTRPRYYDGRLGECVLTGTSVTPS